MENTMNPGDEKLKQSRELDQELEGTFPASDPTSSSQPGHNRDLDRKKLSKELDQELEDTFPASDPPASSQPGHGRPFEKKFASRRPQSEEEDPEVPLPAE